MLYLLGTALLYGTYGTLDIVLLASRVHGKTPAWIAAALMTSGMLAKTALFPLHLWLPPAHSGAPAPASALLYSLVVKAPFFTIVRLWFDAMPGLPHQFVAPLLGALGAGAILAGSILALRQAGGGTIDQPFSSAAWTGGVLQAVSHAFAKAAMFAGAGLIAQAVGHDQISGLRGVGQVLPLTTFGLGLAGLSLMGLPLSGGFLAKGMLVIASITAHQ